jgi:hypothetical protein
VVGATVVVDGMVVVAEGTVVVTGTVEVVAGSVALVVEVVVVLPVVVVTDVPLLARWSAIFAPAIPASTKLRAMRAATSHQPVFCVMA